jgi:hypothetical protein
MGELSKKVSMWGTFDYIYGKVKELAIGSFGEWSDDVHIVIKACAASIAHFTWQESGYSDEEDACALLATYFFKKLAILSLR